MFAELTGDGDEQNLKLVFAAHEVLIRGHHLQRIETGDAADGIVTGHQIAKLPAIIDNGRSAGRIGNHRQGSQTRLNILHSPAHTAICREEQIAVVLDGCF